MSEANSPAPEQQPEQPPFSTLSVLVDRDVMLALRAIVKARNTTIQCAADEALTAWIKANKQELVALLSPADG